MNYSPNSEHTPEAVDLRAYFVPILRRKWLVLAIVVIAGGATYLLSASQVKEYSATTDLYIQTPYATLSSATSGIASSVDSLSPSPPTANQLNDIAQLVTSDQIRALVEGRLGVPVAQVGSVAATSSSSSDFVTIVATSRSAASSARLANAFATAYLSSRKNSLVMQARSAIGAARTTLASLPNDPKNLTNLAERQNVASEIQSYEQVLLNPITGASQPAPAAIPSGPSSPRPVRDTAFGVAVGILLALLAAYGLELIDTRLDDPSEIERAYGQPVLAVLPTVSDPSPTTGFHPAVPPPFTEPLRMLRFQLRLNPAGQEPRVVLVTSGIQNEGKSTIVRDLAVIYAQSGQRVLAIDADFRKQSLARLFGVTEAAGLVGVLLEDVAFSDAVMEIPLANNVNPAGSASNDTNTGSLDLLVAGSSASLRVNLLAAPQMAELIASAASIYDVVLIDTAPLLLVADSIPLLSNADSVLVVARAGVVTRQHAKRLTEIFERLANVRFSGVVVNAEQRGAGSGYGYGYGYGYGNEPGRDSTERSGSPLSRSRPDLSAEPDPAPE